jgi:SAM-dependent methyltransferase
VSKQAYVFDAAHETERRRLESMTAFFEPGTHRILTMLGVSEGWRILEVGGGTGNTTDWLCRQVGASGAVVATDLDTRFLEQLQHPNLRVSLHNIVSDVLEESSFDLVHSRLLLEWLPEREAALRRMVGAVKPGGWVVAEDYDWITWGSYDPAYELGSKVRTAVATLFTSVAGFDVECGLRLPGMLRAAGLVDVAAEGRCNHAHGGPGGVESLALLLEQLRVGLEAAALLTAQEIDQAIADCRVDNGRWGYSPLMVAAWGRKPAG